MSSPDSVAALAQALAPGRPAHALGLTGAACGWALFRLSTSLRAPLVCVTADEESADALADDVAFFFGAGTRLSPSVLRLPVEEVLPWDEVVPESSLVGDRLGALFHLGQGARVAALVLSARALSRKVLPPAVMDSLADVLGPGQTVSRDGLAAKLLAMGYRRAPLVEDAGTFSVRGDILDVFPPLHDAPVRLDFFGDTIESLRSFDAETQRTLAPVDSLTLVPAREVFFSDATRRAAEAALRDAAEAQHVPSSKVRARIEQVREGASSQGLEGLWPGFFPGGLASVFDYLRLWAPEAVVWLDEPAAQQRALAELEADVARSHQGAVARQELTLPPQAHFLSPAEVAAGLSAFRVVEGGGLVLGAGAAAHRFGFASTKPLRDAILCCGGR